MKTELISISIEYHLIEKLSIMARQNERSIHDEIVFIIENELPKLNRQYGLIDLDTTQEK